MSASERNAHKFMNAWTRRDLTIVPITKQDCLVIACDSCGAIGTKRGDAYKVLPRIAAMFTARVALTEILCSGATPFAITNGVSCEMNPTGIETILGIKDEIKNAGLSDIVLTGSTEENYETSMTAMAITVVGRVEKAALKFKVANSGDAIMLLGTPCVGSEVDLKSLGYYTDIRKMLKMDEVKEIVPVGSKGIAYEAKTVAAYSGLTPQLFETGIDYTKSAGPATCILVLCDEAATASIPGIVIGKML